MSPPLWAEFSAVTDRPGSVTAVLGEQLSLSSSVGTNCTIPLLAFFSSHMPSVAENSPGNTFHLLQWWGTVEFWFLHLQITVSRILFWVTFYGLVLFLKTSKTTLVCLVWVQCLLNGSDGCWCLFLLGTLAAVVPRGCVTVTPVVTSMVTPGCGEEPLALPPPCLPAWLCSMCRHEQWAPCLFWRLNTFLALGSGTRASKVLVQKLFLLGEVFWDPYLISHTF